MLVSDLKMDNIEQLKPVDSIHQQDIPGNLGSLINELKQHLNGKGLSCSDIDVGKIQTIMENYHSDVQDWGAYALHDNSRNYTRNGIYNINGNANLLILCWSPGKSSAIHDHANAHCVMKVLQGNLKESLYSMPQPGSSALTCKQETVLNTQQVGYISDDIGLHKITNPDDTISISLHLYTPPYASMYGCSMYDVNGKKHHVDMSKYYSWQGHLVNSNGGSTC